MNNILLVGNGFDLAHGLLTKYDYFLYLLKNWEKFYLAYEIARTNGNNRIVINGNTKFEEWSEEIDVYLKNVSMLDKGKIDKLSTIVNSNSWVKYYCNCEAEIDGWIDFEREIYPVISMFESLFSSSYKIEVNTHWFCAEAQIDVNNVGGEVVRTAKLLGKYVDTSNPEYIMINPQYVSKTYGILKKKLLGDLRKEFDGFIEAFEIYLHEFVYKRDDVKALKQIKELEIGSVISFNYTLTEKLYDIQDEDVHHIHGMIREDLETGINNMVVGVNEHPNQNMEFIYFVKYFQRIQKGSGVKYKRFVDSNIQNVYGRVQKVPYVLYIYGHSLDETDEDILKYIIGDKAEDGRLNLKPDRVEIFYYNSDDYEQKVINLIKLYGRPIVEEFIEMEKFKFIPISE